ncbi:MAG: hypothetical protein QQN64_08155, partial [Nitrosopumilus sp.]
DAADNSTATGLDFGLACTGTSAETMTNATGATFTQTVNVWFSGEQITNATHGFTGPGFEPTTCESFFANGFNATVSADATLVLGAKALNAEVLPVTLGQIGLRDANTWPFIQTFDFNPTGSVTIEYLKAGVNEVVTLTFDLTDGIATYTQDRTQVPFNADIHIEIGDPMLNMDPTSSDEWAFKENGAAHYRNSTTNNAAIDIAALGFGLNGALKITTAFDANTEILGIRANDDVGNST